MYSCKRAVVRTQRSLFTYDFPRTKANKKATALSCVSIRQFRCLICKEENFSPKSPSGLRLWRSLMTSWMVAQVQMWILDHISQTGSVWSAEAVNSQKLTRGTINQAVVKAVQSQRTLKVFFEFQKQEAAFTYIYCLCSLGTL